MTEIKWYARGGQGGFTASRLFALACVYESGKYVQAFPSFGPERRGAPVYGFTRVDDKPILDHSQLYSCDYAVVIDTTLTEIMDVSAGIKENGILFLNTNDERLAERYPHVKTVTFDATGLAESYLGAPISNTAMMVVCAVVTGLAGEESLVRSIGDGMGARLAEKNIALARAACVEARELTVKPAEHSRVCADLRGAASRTLFEASDKKPHIAAEFRYPTNESEMPLGPSAASGIFLEGNSGWRVERPIVDEKKCIRCMQCWIYCPEGVIDREIGIDMNFCKGCGICAKQCPCGAITMVREGKENAN